MSNIKYIKIHTYLSKKYIIYRPKLTLLTSLFKGLDVPTEVPRYRGRTLTGTQEQLWLDALPSSANDSYVWHISYAGDMVLLTHWRPVLWQNASVLSGQSYCDWPNSRRYYHRTVKVDERLSAWVWFGINLAYCAAMFTLVFCYGVCCDTSQCLSMLISSCSCCIGFHGDLLGLVWVCSQCFRLRPNGRIYICRKPQNVAILRQMYKNIQNSQSWSVNSSSGCNAWRQQHRSD